MMVEIQFQSNTSYKNPFKDVNLDVTFTKPDQSSITVPAFWKGDSQWCVRYSSTIIGVHHFMTNCNDNTNSALHMVNGSVKISAYLGENTLLRHGGITNAADNRHFSHEDGTPFFWLGDTWWMGLTKRLTWPKDFLSLTADRKEKGFNVIQMVAGLYPDMPAFDERGLSESGYPWDEAYESINPAFFDEADQRILHLVDCGLSPCILGSWGYYLEWMGINNMKRHWRYLMARWSALPVIWVASGEQTMPWYLHETAQKERIQTSLNNDWSEVMRYMHEVNAFKRLITTHPVTSARESVNDTSLIDFEMQQTGHLNPTQHHANIASSGWNRSPTMPVISAESRYEALEITPRVLTKDVRQAFWAHTINAGLAGHTYGANGIWQVNRKNQAFGNSPSGHNWGTLSWQEAMQLPAVKQISLAKSLITTLPWHTLHNHPLERKETVFSKVSQVSLINKVIDRLLPTLKLQTPVAAATSPDEKLAIYYTATLKPFSIRLKTFKSTFSAYWFDPSNGNKHTIAIQKIANKPTIKFTPIGPNADGDDDWVLIIQAA